MTKGNSQRSDFHSVSGETILSLPFPQLRWIQGPRDKKANRVQPPESARLGDLVFVSTPDQLEKVRKTGVEFIVTTPATLKNSSPFSPEILLLETPNISAAFAGVLPLFDLKMKRFQWTDSIHPTAVIADSAQIGEGCLIGPYVTVGPQARVGKNCRLGSHAVIETEAEVGEGSTIHPHVFIGAFCRVGKNCEIHPHTTIGSDGFGYFTSENFEHKKIPQLGIVVLEDNVEIGANCAIDRATLTETRIGEGTKFDNLCHVAHNCQIGPRSLLAGGFFMAGSSQAGRGLITGGQTVITDHVTLVDRVTLAGRSTVTNDVKQSGVYGGYPLQPIKEALKTISSLGQLVELRKQVSRLMKHLQLKATDEN